MRPADTDPIQRPLRFQVYYSEGPGTDRHLCAEFQTVDACQGYVEHTQSIEGVLAVSHSQFEIVDREATD